MADIPNIEELINLLKGKLSVAIDAAKEKFNELDRAKREGLSGNELNRLQEDADGAKNSVETLSNVIENLGKRALDTGPAIKAMSSALGIDFGETGKLATRISGNLKNAMDNLKGAAVAMVPGIRGIVSPLQESNTVTQALTLSLGKELTSGLKDLLEVQNTVRSSFVIFGRSIEDAEKHVSNYAQSLREMSAFTNMSKRDLNDFNEIIGQKTPEALIKTSEEAKRTKEIIGAAITPAAAAATAFKAFGMSATEAGRQTLKAWTDFGQKSTSVVESLGTMRRAAEDTGVDTATAYEQIAKASSSLAIFGQRIDSTANVWRSFTESLKSGGVPIKEIDNIVSGVVGSLARMSTENRAFISMISGMSRGAGALGGALRMELDMRTEGGLEKNLQALTQTLGQFAGGKIITLEQAVESPQLQNLFEIQRGMLQKMGMGQDNEQRSRILEALQRVQEGGITQVEKLGAAREVFEVGKSLAEKQVDALTQINRNVQSITARVMESDEQLTRLNRNLAGGFEGSERGLERLKQEVSKGEGGDITGAISGTLSDMLRGIPRTIGLTTPFGEISPGNRRPSPQGAFTEQAQRIATGLKLSLQGGRLDELKNMLMPEAPEQLIATKREKVNVSNEALVAQMKPGFSEVSSVINDGNSTIHNDLIELINTTRNGLSNLSTTGATPIAPALGAGATEHNFTVRVIGNGDVVKDSIVDLFNEFEEKMQRNIIGAR